MAGPVPPMQIYYFGEDRFDHLVGRLHLVVCLWVIWSGLSMPNFILIHDFLYQIRNKLQSIVNNNLSRNTISSKKFTKQKVNTNFFYRKRNNFSLYPFCNKISANQYMFLIHRCRIYWSYKIDNPFFKGLNHNLRT